MRFLAIYSVVFGVVGVDPVLIANQGVILDVVIIGVGLDVHPYSGSIR